MLIDSPNRRRLQRKVRCHRKGLGQFPFTTALAVLLATTSPAVSANEEADFTTTTANFTVRSCRNGPDAREFAELCDKLRQQIQEKWLVTATAEPWKPRCQVVVHATKSSYLRAAGRGAGQTSGTSLASQKKGQITCRRIDLLLDDRGKATALPHELTHIVLADAFSGRQPPPWLDEGIATLADSQEKLALHQRDCQNALRRGTAFRLVELLSLERLSSSAQFPAFYGQSVSLVKLLSERDDPAEVVLFAKLAMEKGYDEALRASYEIDGVGQLQRFWLESVRSPHRGQDLRLAAVRLEQ